MDLPDEVKMIVAQCGKCMENQSKTINAHYGIKDEQWNDWAYEMLRDIMKKDNVSEVLDKHFKNLTAEDRCKIQAYLQANSWYERISKR